MIARAESTSYLGTSHTNLVQEVRTVPPGGVHGPHVLPSEASINIVHSAAKFRDPIMWCLASIVAVNNLNIELAGGSLYHHTSIHTDIDSNNPAFGCGAFSTFRPPGTLLFSFPVDIGDLAVVALCQASELPLALGGQLVVLQGQMLLVLRRQVGRFPLVPRRLGDNFLLQLLDWEYVVLTNLYGFKSGAGVQELDRDLYTSLTRWEKTEARGTAPERPALKSARNRVRSGGGVHSDGDQIPLNSTRRVSSVRYGSGAHGGTGEGGGSGRGTVSLTLFGSIASSAARMSKARVTAASFQAGCLGGRGLSLLMVYV